MNLMRMKKKGKAPLSAQAAIAFGGLLLSWGYRRWNRKKAAQAGPGQTPGADVQDEADRLAGKFHSLDKEAQSGHIPKGLERTPKNLEQSTHPE